MCFLLLLLFLLFFWFMFVSCFYFFYSYFVYLHFFLFLCIYLFIFYFLFQKDYSFLICSIMKIIFFKNCIFVWLDAGPLDFPKDFFNRNGTSLGPSQRLPCPALPCPCLTLFVTTDREWAPQGTSSDWKNLPNTAHTDRHHPNGCCPVCHHRQTYKQIDTIVGMGID